MPNYIYLLSKVVLVFIFILAIWLMVALLSFSPYDPGWSYATEYASINNLCGISGAWIADVFFFIFGVVAYVIPIAVIGGCLLTWYYQTKCNFLDYIAISLRLVGMFMFIFTSCCLLTVSTDDIWCFSSGGIIGTLLSSTVPPLLSDSDLTIAFLCIWIISLTLFTGWSWISIAEKIGSIVLNMTTYIGSYAFHSRKLGNHKQMIE